MKIVELSKYAGPQYGLQGSCVNVPTELNDTVNVLPRNLSESETIIVKLQRRMEDKIPYIYEVIRPHKVYQAAEYLTKTEVYIKHNITLDPQWLENTNKQCDIINIQNYDDNVSPEIAGEKNYEILLKESDKEINELDETSTLQTSNSKNGKNNILYDILCDSDSDDASSSNESVDSNTHMQEQESMIIPENIPDHLTQNTGIKMAPGEGKVPISFLKDEDVDVLTYPTIYGGKPRQFKYSLKDAEMRKFELKSFDRRAANNIPKLFMTFCKSRLQRLVNRINCPMFNPDEPSSIAECEKFIDEFMTCKKDDSLGDLINRQYHKHSFTCKRGKQKCRFNYPLVPMRNTKILFPLDDIETNEKKDLQTLFKKIKVDMEKIAKVNEDCSFDIFLQMMNLNEETYVIEEILDKEDVSDNDDEDIHNHTSNLALKNNTGFIQLRRKPKVLRFRNYRKVQDEYDFYRTEVMLYCPWTNENDVIQNALQIYNENETKINSNKKKYNYKLSVDLNDILHDITEKNEDSNSDSDSEELNVSEDFKIFEIGATNSDIATEIPTMNSNDDNIKYGTFNVPKLSSNKEYISLLSSLNEKQTLYHDNFLKLIKSENTKQFFHFISGPGGLWSLFEYYELTQFMRQKNDIAFAQALTRLASGSTTEQDDEMFRSRQLTSLNIPENTTMPDAIAIAYKNVTVDQYNNNCLSKDFQQGCDVLAIDVVESSNK
ncbi:Secretory phospholipase A2 receptor, partial [Frankliniella fusca]